MNKIEIEKGREAQKGKLNQKDLDIVKAMDQVEQATHWVNYTARDTPTLPHPKTQEEVEKEEKENPSEDKDHEEGGNDDQEKDKEGEGEKEKEPKEDEKDEKP